MSVFSPGGNPGLLAKICHLRPGRCDSYVIGDEIIIPVDDIHNAVSPPNVIVRELDSSVLSPLTPQVYLIPISHSTVVLCI